jgi:flagellar biosynthetic protein FliR
MTLAFDTGWLLATLLLSARVAGATALAPVLGPTQIPRTARVMLAVTLGAMLVSALPSVTTDAAAIDSAAMLSAAMLVELFIGASLSLGFLVAYAATQVAGRTLDIQMGFSAGAALNPATQTMSPILGTLFGMVAIAVFLALDGHHVLIKALALSAERAPPGTFTYSPDWEALVRHTGVMFTFGLALAAPVMLALLIADIALAVFARSMPMLNVFVLSFTVKIVLGLTGLAASIRLADGVLTSLFGTVFGYWENVAGTG